MNKFIQAVKNCDYHFLETLLQKEPKWLLWKEESGKNALHFLCGIDVSSDVAKQGASLEILQLLLRNGMKINAVHRIKDGCGFFPATPLWYAYTKGRNEPVYRFLLSAGADPEHCMFAIAWYDDAKAAALFREYGASIDTKSGGETPFLSAFKWRRFRAAEWFLENGADVNAADDKGNTALFYAVKRKYQPEQIELVLRFGADVNLGNGEGVSPKKLAETNGQRRMLQLLNRE